MSIHTVLQITGFSNTTTSSRMNNTKQTQTAQNCDAKTQITAKNLFEQLPENNYLLNNCDTNNETFSFQDFISSIINENDIKWHKLIIQDLERIIELKFREFKKATPQINQFICLPQQLFHKISKEIFKSSLDEPNGILGAQIYIKLLHDDNKVIDLCRFAYDPCTLTTFEITITIKEDVRSLKKLLHAFKLYANFGKYINMYLDENNYEFSKRKLY